LDRVNISQTKEFIREWKHFWPHATKWKGQLNHGNVGLNYFLPFILNGSFIVHTFSVLIRVF
jgi:hypothetical protein